MLVIRVENLEKRYIELRDHIKYAVTFLITSYVLDKSGLSRFKIIFIAVLHFDISKEYLIFSWKKIMYNIIICSKIVWNKT